MIKVMVFIDGTWLYHVQRSILRKIIGNQNLAIDYGKLPHVLAKRLGEQLGATEVDLVRTHFFCSIPKNVDPRDIEEVEKQQEFYDMLHEDYHYEIYPLEIDFKGRRLHKKDRDPMDPFVPEEKGVDIALASTMLYYAAIPHAYDAAIGVFGDQDYIPVLQYVRRLGKRVMIASVHGSCAEAYDPARDPTDSKRVRDADTVFLDEIVGEIVYEPPLQQYECQSPLHKGDRRFWTRERPRKGRPIYCDACKRAMAAQRREIEETLRKEYPDEVLSKVLEGYQPGRIRKLVRDRGFGFIFSKDGKEYFFHASDLRDIRFEELTETQYVQFTVESEPSGGRAGRAREVRPL
jgi:cold shock CspA family protein/uncharacterized LabA/DUF88 family protein